MFLDVRTNIKASQCGQRLLIGLAIQLPEHIYNL